MFKYYNRSMSDLNKYIEQHSATKYIGVRIPFTEEEAQKFDHFLKSSGRKVGAYTRLLILKAMEEESNDLRSGN